MRVLFTMVPLAIDQDFLPMVTEAGLPTAVGPVELFRSAGQVMGASR